LNGHVLVRAVLFEQILYGFFYSAFWCHGLCTDVGCRIGTSPSGRPR
jgi:hypothetical protein